MAEDKTPKSSDRRVDPKRNKMSGTPFTSDEQRAAKWNKENPDNQVGEGKTLRPAVPFVVNKFTAPLEGGTKPPEVNTGIVNTQTSIPKDATHINDGGKTMNADASENAAKEAAAKVELDSRGKSLKALDERKDIINKGYDRLAERQVLGGKPASDLPLANLKQREANINARIAQDKTTAHTNDGGKEMNTKTPAADEAAAEKAAAEKIATAKTAAEAKTATFGMGAQGSVAAHIDPEKTDKLAGLRKDFAALGKDATEVQRNTIVNNMNAIKTEIAPAKEAVFKDLGIMSKTKAVVGANVGQASTMGKIGRVGGSVIGLGAIISGAKNLVAPERDEQGERKGSTWKQLGKIAGGAAAIYLTVIMGGKNKAMGIH